MTKEELAREAYNRTAGEDDPLFDALPKQVTMSLMEIAEKQGDASVFGQEVEKIVIENNRRAEDEVPVLDSVEDLATEEQVRADLKAKTVEELKELAKTWEIKIPAKAKEDEIIELLIPHFGTREKMKEAGVE